MVITVTREAIPGQIGVRQWRVVAGREGGPASIDVRADTAEQVLALVDVALRTHESAEKMR